IAKPVYTVQGEVRLNPNNKFAGLVGFVISMRRLNKQLFDFSDLPRSTVPLVIDEEGRLLGGPDGTPLGGAITALGPGELSKDEREAFLGIVARMQRGERGIGSYSHSSSELPASSDPAFPAFSVSAQHRNDAQVARAIFSDTGQPEQPISLSKLVAFAPI